MWDALSILRLAVLFLVFNVFRQVANLATEVLAESVQDVRPNDGSVLIHHFGQCHPVHTGGIGDLLDGHTPPFPELQVGDLLF